MSHLPIARIYATGVIGALVAFGLLALLERNPQAVATLAVSAVLMGVALAHASAMAKGARGTLSFMHHLSGAALAVAVAATSFAAAYLLNKDAETSNLFALSLALVHLAVGAAMFLAHLAGAYADVYLIQRDQGEAAVDPPVRGPPSSRRPPGRAGCPATADGGLAFRWRGR